MAITLAEAKVGMADKVDQQIIDMFRRSSLLLDRMTFDNCISPGTGGSTLAYGYIQLKTPSTAAEQYYQHRVYRQTKASVKRRAPTHHHGRLFRSRPRAPEHLWCPVDELAFQAECRMIQGYCKLFPQPRYQRDVRIQRGRLCDHALSTA